MMGTRTITNPCCCVDIKKGVLTIGVLDIIFGSLGACLAIFGIFHTIDANTGKKNGTSNSNSTSNELAGARRQTSANPDFTSWLYLVLSMFMILCILQILFGVVLIVGMKREKLLFLKTWLGFKLTGILFTIGLFLSFVFLGDQATFKLSYVDGFSFLYNLYCIWVVYHYTIEVKRTHTGPVKPFRT